ncbi:MAG: ParB/RepB/Spo0J family partition protein [Acidobacteriaceae bacterium]|jgi:ParB/RepB/Spo0J family partition protein
MSTSAHNAKLDDIAVERIERNHDNPRLYFRPRELETLQNSIAQHGIQVPINVYRKGNRFILIDGERRWRCALKLNLKTIPALVQDEPSRLTNVLLMFNIHALREQWDLLTIAVKLPRVIELLEQETGKYPTEGEIVSKTGLNRSVIRRSKLLIDLPERYLENLTDELHKPKPQQKLTEDFFIEMERALKTVERSMPSAVPDKDHARDIIISKYRSGVIKDIVDLRYLPKIAKAERVNVDPRDAEKSIKKVLSPNNYSIEQAYNETVSSAYSEKDLVQRIHSIADRLEELESQDIDDDVAAALKDLSGKISKILRGRR